MATPEQVHWARIAAGIFGLLIVNQGVGIWRFRRKAAKGSKWPSTPGTITVSSIEAESIERDTGDERSRVVVGYSYTVKGKLHAGSRIGWGQTTTMPTPDAQTLSMRYPVGAPVTVFYDPRKPDSALLEPRIQRHSQAMTAMTLFLIVFSAIEIGVLPLAVLGYSPSTPGGMPFYGLMLPVAALAIFVMSLFSYLRLRHKVAASRHWPKVAGSIVSSGVSRVVESGPIDAESTIDRTTTKYRADLRYAYRVGQVDLTATALNLGSTPLYGFARDAEAVASQYPVGKRVDVYYDPADPETACLQPWNKQGTLAILIFAMMFGVAGVVFLWFFATQQFR